MQRTASPEQLTIEGLYQIIAPLEGQRFGNNHTKRLVTVKQADEYVQSTADQGLLTVSLYMRERRVKGGPITHYSFSVDRFNRVWGLGATRRETVASGQIQDAPKLPVAELLKEISRAERIQPKLRR